MHYVIAKAGDHDGFGAIKLYKILWFAEGRTWLLKGRPIAGATYIRKQYGPMPKDGLAVRRELAAEGYIREWKEPYYNREITRLKSLRPVDLSGFDSDDLATLDYWITHIDNDHTAESISEESHDLAWEIAKMGEPLPFHAILTTRIRPTSNEEKSRVIRRLKGRGVIQE